MCGKSHVSLPSPSPSSFFFDMHDRECPAHWPRTPLTTPSTPVRRRRNLPAVHRASHHRQPPAYSLLLSGFHSSRHARPWWTNSQHHAATHWIACPIARAAPAIRWSRSCLESRLLLLQLLPLRRTMAEPCMARLCHHRGPFQCHHWPPLDALNLMTYFSANW